MMLLSGMADGFLCTRIHLPIPITCVYGKFTVSHWNNGLQLHSTTVHDVTKVVITYMYIRTLTKWYKCAGINYSILLVLQVRSCRLF